MHETLKILGVQLRRVQLGSGTGKHNKPCRAPRRRHAYGKRPKQEPSSKLTCGSNPCNLPRIRAL